MIGVIDSDPIKHDKILVWCTTTDIEGARVIIKGLHTRKHLNGSKQIWFYERGHCFQGPQIECDPTGLHQLTHFLRLTKYIHCLSFHYGALKPEVQAQVLIFRDLYRFDRHLIANNRNSDLLFTSGDICNDKVSLHV